MFDNPRLELLVANHGRTIVVVLAVVGVVALAGAGWAAATPETSTVQQETDRYTVDTETRTVATVTSDDSIWAEGTTIEDSPVYLSSASPDLTVEPRTTVPSDQDVTVTHELDLRIEASRNDQVFWSSTETLVDETATTDDGAVVSSAELSIPETRERIHDVADRLSGVGSVRASLELTVHYETEQHAGTLSSSAPLQITDDAYWIDESLSDSTPHSTTVATEVTEGVDWGLVAGLSLLGVFALVGAGFLRFRAHESIDVEQARERLHRERYDEWISPGTLPMWVGQNYIELESLEDVVDVAIDSGQRVVHDKRRELFAVINGDVVYYFSRQGDWDQTSWPELNIPARQQDDTEPTTPGPGTPPQPASESASGPGPADIPGGPPDDGGESAPSPEEQAEEWIQDLPDDPDDEDWETL